MKASIVLATVLAIFITPAVIAAEPSAASAPSKGRTPEEQRNLDAALHFMMKVLVPLKLDQFKDYVAPTFIEHNPEVDGNLESLVAHFKKVKETHPNGFEPPKIIKATVDGDIVTIILVRGTQPDPVDSSKTALKLGFEMLRIKDGKQVEHWDETMIPSHVDNVR